MSGNYVESKKMAKSSAGIAAQRISENNREIVSELEKIIEQEKDSELKEVFEDLDDYLFNW